MKIEDGDYNFLDAYRKMTAIKEHHRAIEDIIDSLKSELKLIKEESFLIHTMRLIAELDARTESSLYTHLQSPMRQTLYLIDVYYSIEIREEAIDMDEVHWDKIAILLDELEMTYSVSIGFPNEGEFYNDERDGKIAVSLSTFLHYFGNAVLSYEEQTLDKIVRYLKPYNEYIQSHYGFTIDEALKFIAHVRILNNNNFNEIIKPIYGTVSFYRNYPEEWRKLTQKFEERGSVDPHEWWLQPELSSMTKAMMTNPGEVYVHAIKELLNVDITSNTLQHILDFFSYNKDLFKGKTVYYADKHQSESHPLIKIGEKCICPINKFLFEGLYFRLDETLMKAGPLRYKQSKDTAFEKKVAEIFQQFFPPKTKIFTNYSIDGKSENDLLVVIGDTCIIVEIKNCNFREPFRDGIKAYDRIKRDFKGSIQLGYEQCKRVEDILLAGQDVDVLDADNKKKVLYQLRCRNVGNIRSIVVTDFKYGMIQTNLKTLLEKDEDALFPWSVCADDLETFLLLLKKMQKGIAPARFIEFLDYRERLQDHVICCDELEICGWYLNAREQFKDYADNDSIINTSPNMGTIFDAYYHVGLGFKNELDMVYKKNHKLPDYPKSFEVSELTSEMARGEI